MNFVERFIIKHKTGRKGDMENIRHRAIKRFAQRIIDDILKENQLAEVESVGP